MIGEYFVSNLDLSTTHSFNYSKLTAPNALRSLQLV